MRIIVFVHIEEVEDLYHALMTLSWHDVDMKHDKPASPNYIMVELSYNDWEQLRGLYLISDSEDN